MYLLEDKGLSRSVTLCGKRATVNCFLGKRIEDDGLVTGIGIAIDYADGDSRINFRPFGELRVADFANARRVLEIFVPAIIRAKNSGKSIERRAIWSALMLACFHHKRSRLPDLGRMQRFMTTAEIDHLQEVLHALGISTAEVEDAIRSGRAYFIEDTARPEMVVPKQTRSTAPLTLSPDHPIWERTGT